MESNKADERISRVIFSYAARIGQAQDSRARRNLTPTWAVISRRQRCNIRIVDTEAGQLYTTVAHGEGEIRLGLTHGLVGACVTGGESIVVNDAPADERFLGRVDEESGYITHSVLVIPLRTAEGTVIGVFQALNKPGGFSGSISPPWNGGDVLCRRYRNAQTEAGIKSARMTPRELAIARDVQAALLPQYSPTCRGSIALCFSVRPSSSVEITTILWKHLRERFFLLG